MEFLSLDVENQKKYLTVPENLKKIKGYISSLKYGIVEQFSTENIYNYTDISLVVRSIGKILENFFSYYEQFLVYDWGCSNIQLEIKQKNEKIKRVVDLYMFALSNFLETYTVMVRISLAAIAELPVIENNEMLEIIGLENPVEVIRSEIVRLLVNCQKIISETWEENIEVLSNLMRSLTHTFNTYPSMKALLPSEWVETLQSAINVNLELPNCFNYLALDIMSETHLPLVFRISVRKWYIKKEEDASSYISFGDICRDTIDIIKRFTIDNSMMLEATCSIEQVLWYTSEEDFLGSTPDSVIESLVYHLGTFLKFYHKMPSSRLADIYDRCCSDSIPLILSEIFARYEELLDSYLVRHIAVSYVSYIQDSKIEINFAIKELFGHLESSNDFILYITSLYDKTHLEKMKKMFSPVIYEIMMKKADKFSSLDAQEFTDVLTSSFIIVPGIIKNGESILWIDACMMKAQLLEKSENPFTREILTIEEWESYNKEKKEMIEEFNERRLKCLNQ